MVKIHIKKGKPIKNERFEGVLNVEESEPNHPLILKISIDGFHQMYICLDKYELENLKKSLKPSDNA